MTQVFSSFAKNYYTKGYHVIPVAGKRPVIKDWSSYNDSPPCEQTYKTWEERHGSLGIGLLCGKGSGVIAVDIDKDSAKSLVPSSPFVKKGAKGETRFFRHNGEPARKFHAVGVEILSDGNQTVIPPSPHPAGRSYEWTGQGGDLASITNLSSLPILPPRLISKLEALNDEASEQRQHGYVALGGRHNTLIRECGIMLEQNMDYAQIIDALILYDNSHHHPPYFTDDTEPHKGKGRVSAENMVRSLIKTREKSGQFYDGSGYQMELVVSPGKNEPKMTGESVSEKIDGREPIYMASEEISPLPEQSYPDASGVIKLLQDHIESLSVIKRPSFALASSVMTMSTMLANKFSFFGSNANLYAMIIAQSGEGKGAPIKYPHKLYEKCEVFEYAGLEEYRSSKAIVSGLKEQHARLDCIDEISRLFKGMNAKNPGYCGDIPELMSALWSHSDQVYTGQTTGDRITTGVCGSPAISLFGATTPEAFSKTFSADNVMQGFGGRFLFIVDTKPGVLKPSSDYHDFCSSFEPELAEAVMALSLINPNYTEVDISSKNLYEQVFTDKGTKKQLIQTIKQAVPRKLACTPEAMELIDEISSHYHGIKSEVAETVRPVVLRASENIKRLTISVWASRVLMEKKEGVPMIKHPVLPQDVEWARQFVDACIKNTESFFEKYLIESENHRDIEKMTHFFEKRPDKYVDRRVISMTCKWLRSTKHREELLKQLIELEVIRPKEGTAYPKARWFILNK